MAAECDTPGYLLPETTAHDYWADPLCLLDSGPALLPPKRAREPHGKTDGLDVREGGMRIGAGSYGRPGTLEPAAQGLRVSVISSEVVRLSPEMPAVERMPRQLTFHQKPLGSCNRRRDIGETQEWGRAPQASRQSILWYAASCLLVCSVVVGAMMLLPKINRQNAMGPRPGQTELVIDKDTREAAKPITNMLAREREAQRIYQQWLTAHSLDELSCLIRDPERIMPKIRTDQLPRLAPEHARPTRGTKWIALDKDGFIFGMLEGMATEYTTLAAYFVTEDGALRMDWEATTGHGSADFRSLARGEGDASRIRGWLLPSDFYTLAFPEARYRCYQLLSPDRSISLWVYAEKETPAHETLGTSFNGGAILAGSPQAEKFTLRLEEGAPDALPNQWRIVELLHKDWIAP